jgi:ketosteroid isomerase-like protein
VTREEVHDWIRGYESAWRSPGTESLRELFAEEATYLQSPYHDPVVGLAAIGAMWEREREGPDEEFEMTTDVFAVEGDRAVVTAEVHYGGAAPREYRDIWLLRFEGHRCAHFEEWPYWPDKAHIAPGS